ncbi:MAG: LysR family transcriptional regulator [Hyphomonadaceae bacterium]|nr:LysR family transcriptional regulator [Hyphomonadaceae bacterium]
MDLRRLEVLVAVAESPTLAHAARRLGMTQPGVSQALKALEGEAGFLLARKTGRKLELTPAGRRLAADAATALHCVAVSVDASRAISEGKAGLIRIAFTPATLATVAGETLRSLRAQAPDLAFELFEMSTNDQVSALLDGRIDAGFLHPPIDADLELTVLLDEPLLAVLPADHPAAGLDEAPLAMLRDTPFVLYPRPMGPVLYDKIIAACQAAGFAPRIAESVLPWNAAMALAAMGFGVALTPRRLADAPPRGAVARPLSDVRLTVPHALAMPRRRRVDAEARLIALARAAARQP